MIKAMSTSYAKQTRVHLGTDSKVGGKTLKSYIEIDFMTCLVFGALISPTDPVAVLGILKKAKVPKNLEVKIVGESLFNDGIGVVVFLTFLGIAKQGTSEFEFQETILLLVEEIGGGIAIGLGLGYIVYRMLKSIDHYETEVLVKINKLGK